MTKPNGLFSIVDDATRGRMPYEYITGNANSIFVRKTYFMFNKFSDTINDKKNAHIQRASKHEFSVAHYTGKITYDAREMADRNRDFVPPEMVETLRASNNKIVKVLFTNQLTKTGNLTVAYEEEISVKSQADQKSKWGAALVAEKQKGKVNTLFDYDLGLIVFRIYTNWCFVLSRNWTHFLMDNTLKYIK